MQSYAKETPIRLEVVQVCHGLVLIQIFIHSCPNGNLLLKVVFYKNVHKAGLAVTIVGYHSHLLGSIFNSAVSEILLYISFTTKIVNNDVWPRMCE